MSFARLHKQVAYLISALGLWALCSGADLPLPSVVLLSVAFVVSYFFDSKPARADMHSRAWTFSLLAFGAIQIARGIAGESPFTLGLEFAGALQISRLFNRHTAKEYQQIAVLAFLHLIAGTVLSTDISYAAIFVGFVIVTPWMLALSHLRREIEGNYPASATTDRNAAADVARVLASRRVVGASFLGGTALLSIPIFTITLVLFLFFPRVGLGFLSFGHGRSQQVAGFSDRIELGGFGLIRFDPTVVMRVAALHTNGGASLASFRMRGTAFDSYDGRVWRRTHRGVPSPERTKELFSIAGQLRDTDDSYSISLEPLREPVVFVPEGTVAIRVPPRIVAGAGRPREIVVADDFEVRYHDADDIGLQYTAYVPRSPEPLPAGWNDSDLYLEIPEHHERVVELARRVIGNATSASEKASRILHFLQSSGGYRYTLDQPEVGNALPLDVFLFRAKAGHCEYFATAMAIMLRSVGVRSRNVTGFLGGHFNSYGNYYVLRQGDAHSWVEALIPEQGWRTYDPTPASRERFGPRENSFTALREFIDSLRAKWTEKIVGFDLESQFTLFQKLSQFFSGQRARSNQERGIHRDEPTERMLSGSKSGWLIGLVALVALGFAINLARLRARRTKLAGASPKLASHQKAAQSLYEQLDQTLTRLQRPRATFTTPLEHARSLALAGYAGAETVREVTDAYMRSRYGDVVLSLAEEEELRAKIRGLLAIDRASSSN